MAQMNYEPGDQLFWLNPYRIPDGWIIERYCRIVLSGHPDGGKDVVIIEYVGEEE